MLVTHVGRNGVRNRLVQQAVEGVKLIYGNRRIHFLGELGDRLAEISVVVDHLLHAVSEPEQLAAVQAGGPARLHRAGRSAQHTSALQSPYVISYAVFFLT